MVQHFWGGFGSSFVPPNAGNLLWTGTADILVVLAKDWWNSTPGSCLLGNDLHPHGCVIGLPCRFPQDQGEFGACLGWLQLPWHREVSRPVCSQLTEASCGIPAFVGPGQIQELRLSRQPGAASAQITCLLCPLANPDRKIQFLGDL